MLSTCVLLALNVLLGADFPGLVFFVSPVLTALLWAPLSAILFSSRLRRRRGEAAT
jgi:cell shape-determining protein MreD